VPSFPAVERNRPQQENGDLALNVHGMNTLLDTQTPRLTQTPLGQPFVDYSEGFSRPFAERFSPQHENLFWRKAVLTDAAAFLLTPEAEWYEAEDVELRVRGEGRRFGLVDCVLYSLGAKGWKEVVTGCGSVVMQPTLQSQDAAMASAGTWKRLAGDDDFSMARAYLMNQLVFEGGMYSLWGHKMVVALEQHVYSTLPPLEAGIAWLVYDLSVVGRASVLERLKTVYTKYPESWGKMMLPWTKKGSHFTRAVTKKYWETIIRCDKNGNIIDKP